MVNGQKPDSYIEYVQDLGNKNWTIAFNVALGSIKKGDTVDLFTTSARDANIGITFSIKAESDTMWSARVRIGNTTYWHKGISFQNYKDFETVTVALEREWIENAGVRANVYYFGEENTSSSAYPKTGMTSLDYDKTNKEGHTPVAKLVFGGVNTSLCQEDCNTIWQPSQLKNYDITFYEIVIVEGLLAEEVSKAIG